MMYYDRQNAKHILGGRWRFLCDRDATDRTPYVQTMSRFGATDRVMFQHCQLIGPLAKQLTELSNDISRGSHEDVVNKQFTAHSPLTLCFSNAAFLKVKNEPSASPVGFISPQGPFSSCSCAFSHVSWSSPADGVAYLSRSCSNS